MKTPNMPIEPRVRKLVDSVSRFPGIGYFCSCGGHDDNDHPGRCRAGQFYVNFTVSGPAGLHSLAVIAVAAVKAGIYCESFGDQDLNLTVWARTEDERDAANHLIFELRGGSGAEPDELAEMIATCQRNAGLPRS